MSKAEENLAKTAATSGAVWLGMEMFDAVLNGIRKKAGLPPLERDRTLAAVPAGAGLVVPAVITKDNPWAPYLAGAGVAVAGRSVANAVTAPKPENVVQAIAADPESGEPTATITKVPDWPHTAKYEATARLFQNMMNLDRQVNGQTVPAERWHPTVVGYARQLLAEAGLDGRDKVGIARAVWEHFKNGRYTYAWDPKKDGTDFFVAPHVFLTPSAEGGFGRVGDCDDVSMAVSAILLALDVPAALVMVDQKGKGYYNHIFPVALLPESEFGDATPKDRRYRYTLPSGETAVVVPLELTNRPEKPVPWLYFPRYRRRAFVLFDNHF